jgi:hypothetical protein
VKEFLHVANGTSTTMTIEAARIPRAVSIWADPLHDGPVPGGLDEAQLVDVRARHLGGHDEPSFSDAVAELEAEGVLRHRHIAERSRR